MRYIIPLLIFTFISLQSYKAQSIEGDSLFALLGSKITAINSQHFFKLYDIQKKINGVYTTSSNGIYIQAKRDSAITLIHLYKNRLPRGLRFDMTYNEVVKMLGKPNYTSQESFVGKDCVYRTSQYEISYHFVSDALVDAEYFLKNQ